MNSKTTTLEIEPRRDPVVETDVSSAPPRNVVRNNVALLGVYYLLDGLLISVLVLVLARYQEWQNSGDWPLPFPMD